MKEVILNRKWQDKNRERIRYLISRFTERSFIKNGATIEDIEYLEKLLG